MKLKIYLVLKKMSITEFSKILRCSRDHLSRVANGTKRSSKKLAEDIEKATNGEVKVEEILAEYKGN
jgi:DNA-binding transcriptional regulator YdaS (Cro superfamily)